MQRDDYTKVNRISEQWQLVLCERQLPPSLNNYRSFWLSQPNRPNKKVQFTTNQCYITNKSCFLPITEQNHQIEDGKLANLVFDLKNSRPWVRLYLVRKWSNNFPKRPKFILMMIKLYLATHFNLGYTLLGIDFSHLGYVYILF